jgi:DNA-binding Lrp family transcriptional regulator
MAKWTEEAKKLLLETQGKEDMLLDFQKTYRPDLPLSTLARRFREFRQDLYGSQKDLKAGLIPEDTLIRILKKKKQMSITDLANYFDVSPEVVTDAIRTLEDKNIVFNKFGGSIELAHDMRPIAEYKVIDLTKYKETEFAIGAIGDQHFGSKYEREDVLNCLFDRFASYGVKTVYQCGNIIDGEARFNVYDIYVRGVEAQVSNLVEKWPQRRGITTEFVTGDDHEGWYVQREHINIGKAIEDEAKRQGRGDMVHLGYMERDIEFKQKKGSSVIRVIHAGGGSSYALSYSSQKYAESLQGGEKPQIVLVGHFHKFDFAYVRDIHVIQVGCTQDQTPWMRKRKLQAMVGGVVLWVKQNELGIFTSVKVEWIPFYDKKFYTYRW